MMIHAAGRVSRAPCRNCNTVATGTGENPSLDLEAVRVLAVLFSVVVVVDSVPALLAVLGASLGGVCGAPLFHACRLEAVRVLAVSLAVTVVVLAIAAFLSGLGVRRLVALGLEALVLQAQRQLAPCGAVALAPRRHDVAPLLDAAVFEAVRVLTVCLAVMVVVDVIVALCMGLRVRVLAVAKPLVFVRVLRPLVAPLLDGRDLEAVGIFAVAGAIAVVVDVLAEPAAPTPRGQSASAVVRVHAQVQVFAHVVALPLGLGVWVILVPALFGLAAVRVLAVGFPVHVVVFAVCARATSRG